MDCVARYPNKGIPYIARNMRLEAHSDAAYLNVSKACIRSGAHIFLSEEEPKSGYNGPILTIVQIIKFVMSSAAEAELAVLFITAKDMLSLHQTFNKMKFPQGHSSTQTNNSTTVGVTSNTIVSKRTKCMDMKFHWL